MNFGDILDAWEKGDYKKPKPHAMEKALQKYQPGAMDYKEKDESAAAREAKIIRRRQLIAMTPQRSIDLHGYQAKEALEILDKFIHQCRQDNLEKVLIIHGKGNHSPAGAVLQKRILEYVQKCRLTGEYGFADRTMGGRGAMWVILRQNKQDN